MYKRIATILLFVLLLPMVAGGGFAQNKPKTLKELVAEEKAAKEAAKAAREAEKEEKAAKAAKTAADARPSSGLKDRSAVGPQDEPAVGSPEEAAVGSPEEAADFVTETDSAIWAPTKVKQLGAQNFGDLTLPKSSMDLQDPNNVTTTVEYQPETGTYIILASMIIKFIELGLRLLKI